MTCIGRRRRASAVGLLGLIAAACGGDTRADGSATAETSTGNGDSTTTGTDETSSSSGDPRFDIGIRDLPVEECAGETVMAEQKLAGARVVFVVDNSPSMYAETAEVQERLNSFATAISDEEIDVRVVMLSAAAMGYYGNNFVAQGICIPPPLGSGECADMPANLSVAPDSLEPEFLHMDQYVNSTNALPVIVEHHPSWGPFTAGADTVHFVVVSDDDSNQAGNYFIEHFLEQEPGRAAIFHAVVPTSDCPEAARIGEEYIALAELTGGVVGDLCDQDFVGVFQALTNAVVNNAELPCEFAVPLPPEGEEFDPMQVNVEYEDGDGDVLEIGNVFSEQMCNGVTDGWYYDDNDAPTAIILCSQTCMDIQGHIGSSVQVVLGCATVPAG